MINKKIIGVIVIILAICLVGVVSLNTTGLFAQSNESTIKIGYLGPLSGGAASIGEGQVKAIELAVSQINSQGGINGSKIELIVEDGQCDAKGAVDAMNKLTNIDNVSYIIGGQCSSETIAIAPIAEEKHILLLSPLSSNPTITSAGDYIFRNYPSDSYQGKIAAEYITNNLNVKKVAILSCLDDWCVGLKNEFKINFELLGGNVTTVEEFVKDSIDLKTQLTKIKNSGAELVYMPAYSTSTISAIKQAKELGIEIKFFGGDAWEESTIWSEVSNISQGFMYTMPKPIVSNEFETEFEKMFPKSEITLAATNNYDALKIIANAIKIVGNDSTKVKNYLYTMPLYNGVSGDIEFDQNGDLKKSKYVVKQIQNMTPTIIDEI